MRTQAEEVSYLVQNMNYNQYSHNFLRRDVVVRSMPHEGRIFVKVESAS